MKKKKKDNLKGNEREGKKEKERMTKRKRIKTELKQN